MDEHPPRKRIDALTMAAIAFVAANVLHTLDHLRQGLGAITTELLAGGSMLTALAIATLVLVLRRDARAPLVATVAGFWSAVGVAASHIAPHWSAFSDSYLDIHVDALSWAVMLAEVAAAAVLGIVGLRQLLRQPAGRPAAART